MTTPEGHPLGKQLLRRAREAPSSKSTDTQVFTLGKNKLLGVLLLVSSRFTSLEQNKRLRSKHQYPWSRLLSPSPCRPQGGHSWFLGWFSGVLSEALSPTQVFKQPLYPQGAQTEDIANTEGKHKQDVIILLNSHNYSDKKNYSKVLLARLLVLWLRSAAPSINWIEFFRKVVGGHRGWASLAQTQG